MIQGLFGKHRFLSNFWAARVEFEGVVYPSVEHAYQAAKTIDSEARKPFAASGLLAKDAKRLGKTLVVRRSWEKAKVCVMLALLRQKFAAEPLKTMLLATGDEQIVEANTWGDVFWGQCNGVGENTLGKLLMRVRAELRQDRGA
jgi:N-glycosidase YbiA